MCGRWLRQTSFLKRTHTYWIRESTSQCLVWKMAVVGGPLRWGGVFGWRVVWHMPNSSVIKGFSMCVCVRACACACTCVCVKEREREMREFSLRSPHTQGDKMSDCCSHHNNRATGREAPSLPKRHTAALLLACPHKTFLLRVRDWSLRILIEFLALFPISAIRSAYFDPLV